MLDELRATTCILTGVLTDCCITITAHDAHVRKFSTWIPADCVAAKSSADTLTALLQLERVIGADVRPASGRSA